MLKFTNISFAIAFFVMNMGQTANASGAVAGATEITQLLNNGQLMMQVVESQSTTATVIKHLMEAYKQAEREILHLKGISDDVVRVARLAKEKDMKNIIKAVAISQRVHGDVSKLGNILDTRIQEAYKNGLSIADYVQAEGNKIARQEKQAIARVELELGIVENLQDDLTDISELANDIPLTEGTQQSLGLMNTQMNKMLVSMNRIGRIIQSGQENSKKAIEEAEAVVKEKHAQKFADSINKRNQQLNDSEGFLNFNAMTGQRFNANTN